MLRILLAAIIMLMGMPAFSFASPSWPHEPAGWTVLDDNGMNTIPPGPKWSCLLGVEGPTISQDATAPFSPQNVWNETYPIGEQAGLGPGHCWLSDPLHTKEYYWAFWWKQSLNWQVEAALTTKLGFLKATDKWNVVFGLLSFGCTAGQPCAGPYNPGLTYQDNNTVATTGFPPTINDGVVGTHRVPQQTNYNIFTNIWYLWEIHAKQSTSPTSLDGVFEMWICDISLVCVQTHNVHNFNMNVQPLYQIDLQPIWGGGGATKTQVDHYWWDHIRVTYPGGTTDTIPPTPPSALTIR